MNESADLSGSVDLAQTPVFEFHRSSSTIAGCCPKDFNGTRIAFDLDKRLDKIIRQLHDVTVNMNLLQLKTADFHPLTLREDITSLQYALLSFAFQADNGLQDLINETVRLTHLMYLVTLLDEAIPGTSICDGLGRKLSSCLGKLSAREVFTDEFLLWTAFCAASMVMSKQNLADFHKLAIESKKGSQISSWDEAEVALRSFFWLDKIHGKTFRRVWRVLEALESDNL